MFVTPDDPEIRRLEGLGLVESFRRRHPGQGTANVCFCSDNAYLELLWIVDAAEAGSSALARCDLIARADWRRSGVSPFGIALRNSAADASLPFPSWDYCAPFLPAGTSVPVAIASDDPRQPLLFRTPGNRRPDQWTDAPAGLRQRQAGLADLLSRPPRLSHLHPTGRGFPGTGTGGRAHPRVGRRAAHGARAVRHRRRAAKGACSTRLAVRAAASWKAGSNRLSHSPTIDCIGCAKVVRGSNRGSQCASPRRRRVRIGGNRSCPTRAAARAGG